MLKTAWLLCLATLCRAAADPERLIIDGHWKQARAIVEERLRANPNDAEANYLASMIRAAFGDRESPMKLAEKAVSLNSSVSRYHRQVAEVIGVTAQQSNALQKLMLARRFRKEIDAALALDGRDLQALRDLLEYYLLAPGIVGGDKNKARETASRIAKLDAAAGFSAEARIASFNGKRDVALELLRKAVQSARSSYGARMELARYYLDPMHDLSSAEAEAREAVRIDPSRADGYSVLAQVYGSTGRWREVDEIVAEARKQVPDDLAPLYYAATGAITAGQDEARAQALLRQYLKTEPEGNEPTIAEARAKSSKPAP
jgi:predicted Zn-dependent protease